MDKGEAVCTFYSYSFLDFITNGSSKEVDDDMKWKVLPPMPKQDSHIDFACAIVNRSLVNVEELLRNTQYQKDDPRWKIFQFHFDT
ncbi:hypothetical protein RND71_038584 [Anisodus tanguticus]|uniref:Uncharacterized protein n=1 Tax=Anisodus tanguticus TaxID=243964 RepID=A0AAE1R0S6_9SOLA|nr:hypothetical protein RND71_038584 [Anisodus tanguticus]